MWLQAFGQQTLLRRDTQQNLTGKPGKLIMAYDVSDHGHYYFVSAINDMLKWKKK